MGSFLFSSTESSSWRLGTTLFVVVLMFAYSNAARVCVEMGGTQFCSEYTKCTNIVYNYYGDLKSKCDMKNPTAGRVVCVESGHKFYCKFRPLQCDGYWLFLGKCSYVETEYRSCSQNGAEWNCNIPLNSGSIDCRRRNNFWYCKPGGQTSVNTSPDRRLCGLRGANYWIRPINDVDCCHIKTVVTGDCCQKNDGQCYCQYNSRCEAPPPMTKKPAKPKLTTPKPTTQRMATPEPTTQKATKPTTPKPTTPKPTTPKSTTPKVTTPAPRKLCSTIRLLNGKDASTCDYPGIVSIENTVQGKVIRMCNAAFVRIMQNNVLVPAFFTTSLCSQTLNFLVKKMQDEKKKDPTAKSTQMLDFVFNQTRVPVDVGNMLDQVKATDGASVFYVVNARSRSFFNFNDPCKMSACTFTSGMFNQVDFRKCDMVSYGTVDLDLSYKGLQSVAVSLTSNAQCSSKATKDKLTEQLGEADTMCFRSVSNKNVACAGDAGAAVYCKSDADEQVLIGLVASQNACDTNAFIRVVPYPSDIPSGVNPDTLA